MRVENVQHDGARRADVGGLVRLRLAADDASGWPTVTKAQGSPPVASRCRRHRVTPGWIVATKSVSSGSRSSG